MIPWELLGRVPVAESGEELRLFKRGSEFSIRLSCGELMNSRQHGSEEALAELACAKIAGRPSPRILIGGLGMGYSVAAALAHLGADSQIIVAELVPAVVQWNRGPLADLAGQPLQDARVTVRETDVAHILRAETSAFDAILLDVDNGPAGLTRKENDWLYSRAGLAATHAALRPAGVLAVWSAGPDRFFTKRLHESGFGVEEILVRARANKGSRHTIWLASKRPAPAGSAIANPSNGPNIQPQSKQHRTSTRPLPHGLVILHEDRDIIVVDKPAGLLSVTTERDETRTAYYILTDYVRKGCARSSKRIFIVHRLDRDTSGLLVFAKTEQAKIFLQGHWEDTAKKYLAVVHGTCKKSSDTISTYLAENAAHVVYSTSDTSKGKLSHTAYRVLKQVKDYALLEIDLLTGRKNQIRVHLAGIGHPIVGDIKYGKSGKSFKRLALHAFSMSFKHPFTGKPLTFEAPIPGFFTQLVGGVTRPLEPSR